MFRPRRILRRGAPLLRGALVGGAGYLIGRNAARPADREDEPDAAVTQLSQRPPAQRPPAQRPPPQPAPVQRQPVQPQPGRSPWAASGPVASPVPDVADQLAQLTDLHSRNVLTDAEFAAAKARLLNT